MKMYGALTVVIQPFRGFWGVRRERLRRMGMHVVISYVKKRERESQGKTVLEAREQKGGHKRTLHEREIRTKQSKRKMF